jgi:hypothetical protein
MGRTNKLRSIGPRTAGRGTEKPGRSWGKIQRAPGLAIVQILGQTFDEEVKGL